ALDCGPARCAMIGVFQPELELVFDVAALACAAAPAPSAGPPFLRARATPEKRVEEIRERIGVAEPLLHFFFAHGAEPAAEGDIPRAPRLAAARRGPARGSLFVHPPVRAELVVLLPLLGIAEHLVGLVDLLEPGLGRLVARIDVRVVFARQFPVRLLELLLRRGFRYAEGGVVVLEIHRQSKSSIRISASSSWESRRRASRADSVSSRMRGRM